MSEEQKCPFCGAPALCPFSDHEGVGDICAECGKKIFRHRAPAGPSREQVEALPSFGPCSDVPVGDTRRYVLRDDVLALYPAPATAEPTGGTGNG